MLKSIIIAFSTYSRIPMPRVEWDDKGMRYALCFFPLVGALVGLCACAAYWLMVRMGFSEMARATVLTALPLLITGGIHMDGYLDTADAISSYKSREEKLRILKDPHLGAFALIAGLVYVLLSLAFYSCLGMTELCYVAAGFVFSRILSGLAVVTFPKAKPDGMLVEEARTADVRMRSLLLGELALCLLLLAAVTFLFCLGRDSASSLRLFVYVLCLCAAAGGTFYYYKKMSLRVFGGTSGDLAGYFLQICELAILAAIALAAGCMNMLL